MCRTAQVLTLVVAVIIAAASVAEAGWVVTDASGEETLVSKGKMKSRWENGAMIMDANKSEVHFIDDSRKMIASSNVDEFCEEMEQMVETVLENIPPEQREMVKQMMGDTKAAEVKVLKKGKGEKVAGFETTRYEVMADGELYEELWLTSDKALMKDCEALLKELGRFMSCMARINSMGMGSPSPEASPEYAKIFEMGMIVKSVGHAEGSGSGHPDVTDIAKRDVPDSTFDLPDGYKAVSFAAMWGMAEK